MPDTNNKLEQLESNSDTNKEVASKLENQDTSLRPTPTAELQHTDDALDALAAKVSDKKKDDSVAPPEKKDDVVISVQKKDDSAAPPPPPAPDPAIEAAKKRADDFFKDSPTLPANASPKSTEAFSSIKIRAAQEISAKEAEIEKLRKENEELQSKLKDPVPEDFKKELEDHRTWRAKLDVELDPKFKQYDKAVSEAQEFIYAQLRKSPAVTDEVIERIKSHGGPENVQLEKIFEAMKDPTIQRLVESKVADIEMAKFNKERAIKAAKENVTQYLTERQKAWEESATAHTTATKSELDKLTTRLEWLKEKPVTDKATPEEKTQAETHNKFLGEVRQHVQNALQDDSPEMRAIQITGMAQLLYLQRVHEGTVASLAAEKKLHEETKKLLADEKEKLERIKRSGASRLRESAAPPGGKLPTASKDIDLRPASQAIDDVARQIMEERQRASAAG